MKYLLAALLLFSINAYADKLTLTPYNTVNLRGPVTDASMMSVQLNLAHLNKIRGIKAYPIYLVLDSPGGSIESGLSFIEYARTIRNLQTVSIFSASMASGIVEAIPGKRYITDNGVIMFHRAKGGFEGQFEEGEVEQELALFKAIVKGMEQTNADRLGLSLQDYKDKAKDEYWLYGKAAVAAKASDASANLYCTQTLIDKRDAATVQTMFGAAIIEFSGCPLFRTPLKVKNDDE